MLATINRCTGRVIRGHETPSQSEEYECADNSPLRNNRENTHFETNLPQNCNKTEIK